MSPKTLARTTGALNLLLLLGGIVAQGVIADELVVRGDAAATAGNIVAHPKLWALGLTVFLIEMGSAGGGDDAGRTPIPPSDQRSSILW